AAGASLTLTNLTLRGGLSQGKLANDYVAAGGALYSGGALTVEGCTIRNNATIGGTGQNALGSGLGGGLYVAGGSVALHAVSVSRNEAQGGAGGRGGDGAPRGFKRGHNGNPGDGIGGGIYIEAAAAGLDSSTVDHARQNRASTS